MKKTLFLAFKLYLGSSLLLGSLCFSATLEEAQGMLERDFTNYVLRAFEVSGETPNHYLMGPLKEKLTSMSALLDSFFEENPAVTSRPTGPVKELEFFHAILKEALNTVRSSEEHYSDLEGASPFALREWSFNNMIESKKRMVALMGEYLDWAYVPQNLGLLAAAGFSRWSLKVAFSFKALLGHRFNTSFQEDDRYKSEVLEPLSEQIVNHMHWLSDLGSEHLAYFNDLFLSTLGTDTAFLDVIYKKLMAPENIALLKINDQVGNDEHATSGFSFAIGLANTHASGDRENSDVEDLLEATLTPEEREWHHIVWTSYYPDSMTEYLLTETSQINHPGLIVHLSSIKQGWKNLESFLAAVGVSTPASSAFEYYTAIYLINLDHSAKKGIFDVIQLIRAYFSSYIPPGAGDAGAPFSPNPSHAFASLTNPHSVISSLSYSLSTPKPILLRKFYERLTLDFVRLSDQMTPLESSDLEDLNSVFKLYGNMSIRSKNIESLALFVLQNNEASVESRTVAGQYLLRSSIEDYSYVEATLERLKPRPMNVVASPYGADVTINSADGSDEYGLPVGSVSPYSLVKPTLSCRALLK